jgi:hypothetical protein
MRQLKIDLSELEMAFDSGSEMISYYLDLETGEVISLSVEERGLLESIYESYYDEQSKNVDWENAFEKEHVPDWQREQLQNADRVEAGFGDRFFSFQRKVRMMVTATWKPSFRATMRNRHLQERLERAIRGAAPSGISKMCSWITPPSGSVGSSSSRCACTKGCSTG